MSRKDYIKFAELLKAEVEKQLEADTVEDASFAYDVLESVAYGMAKIFKADNPSFDPSKFMDAIYD
jgi:predicted DNA-binding protein